MMKRVTVEQKGATNGSFASIGGGVGSDPLSFKCRTHLRYTGYMLATATHI